MRPTFLRIDLDAVRNNAKEARFCAPESKMLACVKANAYGHGIALVAEAIESEVDGFGVANLDEGLSLRAAGIRKPVLLLEGLFEKEELETAIVEKFSLTIHSQHQIDMLIGCDSSDAITVWLKMDTGMHRLGFSPSEYISAYRALAQIPCVKEIVLMTHFACADDLQDELTLRQIDRFNSTTQGLAGARSLANSSAILAWKQSHMDWIRPGFMLYGLNPVSGYQVAAEGLIPAMEMLSEVVAVREINAGESVGYSQSWTAKRDSRIAVIALGYGDGYPRNTLSGTPVLVDGQLAQSVGLVAMDMMMVDVTELPSAGIGSPVELWGKNLSINKVAENSGFSPYELMTRLPDRLPRIYLKS